MRPTKFTPELLDAFRAVLADEWSAVAFTEEELVWQANRRLPQADRISYRTYLRYKAILETQDTRHETQDLLIDDATSSPPSHGNERMDKEGLGVVEEANTQLIQDMHDTLKEALLTQKKALVRGVCEGQPNWRRYTWLLERKFPDFRLKPLSEALGRKVKPPEPEKEPEDDEQTKTKRREAYFAKIEAQKAAERELNKDPYVKWDRGYLPWTPFNEGSSYSIRPHELKAKEEELARDVAAGYQNPFAHLGYRPDPIERTDGIYVIIGMGMERLPLRVHVYRFADEPNSEEREELWLIQEQERRNIIRAEQGLPPENLPEPTETSTPDSPTRRGPGVIYGTSGG